MHGEIQSVANKSRYDTMTRSRTTRLYTNLARVENRSDFELTTHTTYFTMEMKTQKMK